MCNYRSNRNLISFFVYLRIDMHVQRILHVEKISMKLTTQTTDKLRKFHTEDKKCKILLIIALLRIHRLICWFYLKVFHKGSINILLKKSSTTWSMVYFKIKCRNFYIGYVQYSFNGIFCICNSTFPLWSPQVLRNWHPVGEEWFSSPTRSIKRDITKSIFSSKSLDRLI